MATSPAPQPVVVGIDGTPAGHRGVRYAAMEARRLGAPLAIVHVTPGYALGAGVPAVPEDVLRAYGLELLESARKNAQATVSGLVVETTLVAGGTSVSGLVDHSRDAVLLVLGAERRTFAGRVWTGDIVAGVAARAICPVIVVPPEWEPHHEHGRVIVGVKDVEHAGDLVSAGLALADGLGAELDVLHAWKAPSGYDDMLAIRTYAVEYGRTQTDLLEPIVRALRAECPNVPVRTEVLHSQPAHLLVGASADADRLIISRPRHGGRFHHLGGVGRAVLNESRCPVEVRPIGHLDPPE